MTLYLVFPTQAVAEAAALAIWRRYRQALVADELDTVDASAAGAVIAWRADTEESVAGALIAAWASPRQRTDGAWCVIRPRPGDLGDTGAPDGSPHVLWLMAEVGPGHTTEAEASGWWPEPPRPAGAP